MKLLILLLLLSTFYGCSNQDKKIENLQIRVDSLESKLAATYNQGLGDFMISIQAHHIKLWFAGKNKNWKLADYLLDKIIATVEDIRVYAVEQKESRMIGTITPALESLSAAIKQEDSDLFRKGFTTLTTACNQCHRAANKEFNVIKIPDENIFHNQEFNPFK